MIVDFKPTTTTAQDPANREIQAREADKQISLGMYPMVRYATQAAERLIKTEGFPLAMIRFKANRNAFQLKVGDLFVLNYAPGGGLSRNQAGKAVKRHRRAEVVADGALVVEEIRGHHRADGVQPAVFRTRRTTAVTVEPRHRIRPARLQRFTQNVAISHRSSIDGGIG